MDASTDHRMNIDKRFMGICMWVWIYKTTIAEWAMMAHGFAGFLMLPTNRPLIHEVVWKM